MPKVGIVMGSISDFEVVKKAIEVLKEFNIEVEARILSAHRTPYDAAEYARTAERRGINVIIAAAGKAAHLPGVLASYTVLPVIGLPIKSSTMDGLDSLLSIVQMPAGIPVATVAVNGSEMPPCWLCIYCLWVILIWQNGFRNTGRPWHGAFINRTVNCRRSCPEYERITVIIRREGKKD